MRHVKTDPLCAHHRRPRHWWQLLRFDRGRGHVCQLCVVGRLVELARRDPR